MSSTRKKSPVSSFCKFFVIDEDGDSKAGSDTLDESIRDAKDEIEDEISEDLGETISMGVYKLVKVVTVTNRGPETVVTSVA